MDFVISILALTVLVLFLFGILYSPYLWQHPPSAEAEARDRSIREVKRARHEENDGA